MTKKTIGLSVGILMCLASNFAMAENWLVRQYCQQYNEQAVSSRDFGILSKCPQLAADCPPPGDNFNQTYSGYVHQCDSKGGTYLTILTCFDRVCKGGQP